MSVLNACNGNSSCLASTRVAIARGILESAENQAQVPSLNPASANYKADFIEHCYWDLLQRTWDPDGVLVHYQ